MDQLIIPTPRCSCGRQIAKCDPVPRWRRWPNSTAVWFEAVCCHCVIKRVRLAAETARLVDQT